MKTKFTFLLVAVLWACSAQSQNVGYLVVTDTGKITAVKTLKLVDVYTIAETVFPANCIDFEKELNKSPFIEIRSGEKSVYIEKKKVGKNGRFKRIKP